LVANDILTKKGKFSADFTQQFLDFYAICKVLWIIYANYMPFFTFFGVIIHHCFHYLIDNDQPLQNDSMTIYSYFY
jgi:hypothetical protein